MRIQLLVDTHTACSVIASNLQQYFPTTMTTKLKNEKMQMQNENTCVHNPGNQKFNNVLISVLNCFHIGFLQKLLT